MADKPVIALARWADQIGSFVTDPSSGERDTGFEDGEPAEADKVNALLLQLYLWALYLDEGALVGDHSIDGDLTVGGQPLVFADFTYTADAGTDTLTKVAHGLETGDGAARTTNSGGGLPGGLAVATDYFVIRTGADTFKLAASRALALAGTAIDITSAGTGTHTLIDQAGTTRVTDATVTRDLTVGGVLDAPGHPDRTLNLAGLTCTPGSNISFGTAGEAISTGACIMRFSIPLLTGDRIKSVTFARIGDGAADILGADVFKAGTTGGFGTINVGGTTVTVTNPAAAWGDTPVDTVDTKLASGEVLFLALDISATGISINNLRVVYDHPPE